MTLPCSDNPSQPHTATPTQPGKHPWGVLSTSVYSRPAYIVYMSSQPLTYVDCRALFWNFLKHVIEKVLLHVVLIPPFFSANPVVFTVWFLHSHVLEPVYYTVTCYNQLWDVFFPTSFLRCVFCAQEPLLVFNMCNRKEYLPSLGCFAL